MDIDFSGGLPNFESFVLKQPLKSEDFATNLIAMGQYGCNLSHEIQNNASKYIRVNPGKDIANMLINQAGNMENQFRAIEAHSRNFIKQVKNNNGGDNQKQNYCKNVNKNLDNAMKSMDNIAKRNDNADLDLKRVDGIEGSLQILVATVRENIKLQFGM